MRYTRLAGETDHTQAQREALRRAELELIDQRERVAAQRRALPPIPIDDYVFLQGPASLDDGDDPVEDVRLGDLFSNVGRPLVVYHLMFGKALTSPCPMCTMWVDGFNALARHIGQNMDFAVVAAADPGPLRAHARTQGWHDLRLMSCGDSTFKYDLGSEDDGGNQVEAISVFTATATTVLHHYTSKAQADDERYERGLDLLTPVWNLLDLLPAGRPVDWYPSLPPDTT